MEGYKHQKLHVIIYADFLGIALSSQTPTVVLTRFASKKSGGSSKNLGGNSAGRRYGHKKHDGTVFLTTDRCLI